MATPVTPERIIGTALGFWPAKTLLSAVELGVFTELSGGPLPLEELASRLELHPRGARDFLDTLVAIGMLERNGTLYSNTAEADLYLDRTKQTYVGGLLEMSNARLYPAWGNLTESLHTGRPQNGAGKGGDPFAEMYRDPAGLRAFLSAMTGITAATARELAVRFPWRDYRTFGDVGTAQGALPVAVASAHEHLAGYGFDLPVVQPVFEEYVARFGLNGRVRFRAGDFFREPLPQADVLVMGRILHDWGLDEKCLLLRKAYEALPPGGSLIVIESLIDDDRRQAFGLLMSLNMLVETPAGFDYTGADCRGWMREAGFSSSRVEHLAGPDSMVVAVK